jgi:hypothetical protein
MPQLTKSITSKEIVPWGIISKSVSLSQSVEMTSLSNPWYKSLEIKLPREILFHYMNMAKWYKERDYSGDVSLTRGIGTTLEELRNVGISIQRQEEIYNYLLLYPDMIRETVEIAKIALKSLPDVKLFLEVYNDPESEDSHLVLYARFRVYSKFTIEKIKSVRKEYRNRIVDKNGWLLLTTDFKPIE